MSDADQILKRLDSLDLEMREMRKLMTQMAATEVRVATLIEQNSILFQRIDDLRTRISDLETENAKQGKSISFFERFGWLVAGGAASLVTYIIKG